VPEAKSTEETFNFDFGIRGPHTNVVAMLIRDTGTFNAEFQVHTIAIT
jgi:hypothetical protein